MIVVGCLAGQLFGINYCINVNTTALLIRAALDNFLNKSQLFGALGVGKYFITTVKFGSNLNVMAPKNQGQKLEWHHSVCIDTVIWGN